MIFMADEKTDKTQTETVRLTPEQQAAQELQKQNDDAYQRAKFLHANNYGPDPDKEVITLPDGTDERGRPKMKEWDFRPKAGDEPPADKPPAETTETETEEQKAAREEEERKKAEAKAADRARKPKKAKAEAPAAPPAPSQEELVTAAATAAVEAVRASDRLKPGLHTPAEDLELSAADKRVLEVLGGLETENEGYKGIKEATISFWRKERAYVENWEKEHPGEVFDRESDHYLDFCRKQNPEFKHANFDEDFERMQIEQAAERVVQKRVSKLEATSRATEEKVETKLRMREEAQEVVGLAQSGKAEFVALVVPELVKAVAGEDEFEITPEAVAKMEEHATPVQMRVIDELSDELGLQLVELERLSRYPSQYRPNENWKVELKTSGREVYPHRELLHYAARLEAAVASDPKNARGGKAFLTSEDWQKRVDSIMQGAGTVETKRTALQKLDATHYRLGVDDIRGALIAEYGARAKRKITELEELVALTGKKNGAAKTALGAEVRGQKSEVKEGEGTANTTVNTEQQRTRSKPPASASASDRVNAPAPKELTEAERLELARAHY